MRNLPSESAAAERYVTDERGVLYVRDQPGAGSPIVLMHGFPDDHHIYDQLTPFLANRAVSFDWLGYGRSRRNAGNAFTRTDRQRDLSAVIDALELDGVVLVGHDASGPDAIDWALAHPERVARIVLFNTLYGNDSALRMPEWTRLLSDPGLTHLADALMDDPQQRRWLLGFTARRFGLPDDPNSVGTRSIGPQFFGGPDHSDSLAEIRAWTGDLRAALKEQDQNVAGGRLAALPVPVSVIFGADDPFLNPELAKHLAGLFETAELTLIPQAAHWVQWDQPGAVAEAMDAALNERVPAANAL